MAKQFRVETIKSGFWTGTLKSEDLQNTINKLSNEGWEYKNCQDVIGRRCGCIPTQIVWAIFEKD